MARILIADPIDAAGVEILRASGAEVHEAGKADRERLPELLADFDALVVRSMTKVTADLLRAGKRLKVVGRAGIGVDNVDVQAATELGILVVNAPTANVLSATEHTFAMLLALARKVPAADAAMKREVWDRQSFLGNELQGKTLGVIGFGRIGQRVAARARAFEMKVLAYDPFLDPAVARRLDVTPLPLDELLAQADVVTLHTPFTAETRGMLDRRRIGLLKAGALLVNCGRGGLVDEAALLEALEAGRLAGAALDVFADEPPKDWALARHPSVVATPHIGAQTVEAQERISTETARMVLAALAGSLEVTAVNLPFGAAGVRGEPFLRLGEQLGTLASALHGAAISRLQVDLCGIEEALQRPLTVAVLKGALSSFLGEAVNYVNAEVVAAGRGIEVVSAIHQQPRDYAHELGVTIAGEGRTVTLAGTLFGERDPRVVSFDGFRLEFRPSGRLLVLRNRDVPGVVGKLGTLLGSAGINIAEIHLARRDGDADALAVLRLDQEPPAALMSALRALPEIRSAQVVDLPGHGGN
jgi:D-3-phosphoglycerate dehydrogenase / 2-oxoglutarate reductase